MKFLIYQDKRCPGWVYDKVKQVAESFGHQFIKWEPHLQQGKHFDGTLIFPRVADALEYVCRGVLDDYDEDDDDIAVEIGRGIYEGAIANRPNTYLVCYDDARGAKSIIHLLQGYEVERGDSSDDYNEWGKLVLSNVEAWPISERFALLKNENKWEPTGTRSYYAAAKRMLLLLLNR